MAGKLFFRLAVRRRRACCRGHDGTGASVVDGDYGPLLVLMLDGRHSHIFDDGFEM